MDKIKFLLTRYALLKNIDIFAKENCEKLDNEELVLSIQNVLADNLSRQQKESIDNIDQLVKNKLGITNQLSKTVEPIFKQLTTQEKAAFNNLKLSDQASGKSHFSKQEMMLVMRKALDSNEANLQNFLSLMEIYWMDYPFYKDVNNDEDISLFDYSKLLAAIIACLVDDKGNLSSIFPSEDQFLLLSMDMSGVQDFIYNISGERALKSLRARSFYLEIMLEYLTDVLLNRFDLSRINVIYTGGGHANILLANTPENLLIIDELNTELSKWFMHHFRTDLSVVIGTLPCSFNDLMNEDDSFQDVWRNLGQVLSEKKSKKYGASQILYLNQIQIKGSRECKECLRSDVELSGDDESAICSVCKGMIDISNRLLDNQYFIISNKGILDLPFQRKLDVVDEKTALKRLANDDVFIVYSKQNHSINEKYVTQIWMGDYDYARLQSDKNDRGINNYVKREKGIQRLGVLRADVDNLGATFLSGIPNEKRNILRTASLSRAMSRFFKKEINDLLKDTKISIIYSGGDDLFFIGAWEDIIFASIKIRKAFQIYTLNKLSFSAGIGIYGEGYPVARMAYEVGKLEDRAKEGDKNQVSLWIEDKTFSWIDLDRIIQEKYNFLLANFNNQVDKGNSFLYKMLLVLRNNESIQLARLAYLLSRSGLDTKVVRELYSWLDNPSGIKEFITAIELYIFTNRE